MEQLKFESVETYSDTKINDPRNVSEIETLIVNVLRVIERPDDLLREGLRETPARVAKAYATWFGGYDVDIAELFKTFEDGAEGTNELVIVRDIPVYSHCEHHMAPIIGRATVGYVPNGKIVGLSKLSRVVDAFARRLQVQERLTNQIADAIWENLDPLAVCVYIDARHMCMEARGIKQISGSSTITKAFRGVTALDSASVVGREWRREFLQAANNLERVG